MEGGGGNHTAPRPSGSTPLDRLGAGHLRDVVVAYRDALRAHQEAINRLNVYPVPDGDTGTNMALTLESVVRSVNGADDMASVCRAIAHGSLMGASGNSGVILSQVLPFPRHRALPSIWPRRSGSARQGVGRPSWAKACGRRPRLPTAP